MDSLIISACSVLNHGCLNSSLNLVLRSRSGYFLNIEHFSHLVSWLSDFPQVRLRLLFSDDFESAFWHLFLVFLVLYEGNALWICLGIFDWFKHFLLVKVFLLKFIHVKLCLFDRINKFMENSFLFVRLFLSNITLSN